MGSVKYGKIAASIMYGKPLNFEDELRKLELN